MGILYEDSTTMKDSETIVIPRTVQMPTLRYAAPSGTLAQGDTISGTITLKDKDGNIKPLAFDGFKIDMTDWPDAEDEEILAVLYMNFVVSKKAVVPKETIIPVVSVLV